MQSALDCCPGTEPGVFSEQPNTDIGSYIMFSDETRFNLIHSDRRMLVWRQPRERIFWGWERKCLGWGYEQWQNRKLLVFLWNFWAYFGIFVQNLVSEIPLAEKRHVKIIIFKNSNIVRFYTTASH